MNKRNPESNGFEYLTTLLIYSTTSVSWIILQTIYIILWRFIHNNHNYYNNFISKICKFLYKFTYNSYTVSKLVVSLFVVLTISSETLFLHIYQTLSYLRVYSNHSMYVLICAGSPGYFTIGDSNRKSDPLIIKIGVTCFYRVLTS